MVMSTFLRSSKMGAKFFSVFVEKKSFLDFLLFVEGGGYFGNLLTILAILSCLIGKFLGRFKLVLCKFILVQTLVM